MRVTTAQRYRREGARGIVIAAVLGATVAGLHDGFGIAALPAIVISCCLGSIVAATIRRYWLPAAPPLGDRELAAIAPVRWRWLPLGMLTAVAFHFALHLDWWIAIAIAACGVGGFACAEQVRRVRARRRLASIDSGYDEVSESSE